MLCSPDFCWPVPLRPSYLPRQFIHCGTELLLNLCAGDPPRHSAPVCMTVCGVKLPCLPVQLYNRDFEPDCCQHDDAPAEESLWDDEQQEGLYIEPTSVPR